MIDCCYVNFYGFLAAAISTREKLEPKNIMQLWNFDVFLLAVEIARKQKNNSSQWLSIEEKKRKKRLKYVIKIEHQ